MALDIIQDMHMSASVLGILASVFFFTYGVMQLPSGLLADSLGPRRTLPLFFALAAGGAMLFGLADSVSGLFVGRALMGLGLSVVFICGIKLISSWFAPRSFARMSGIYLGMGGVGLILGSAPMAWLCSFVGWRTSLVLLGGIGLGLSVALWFLVRDKPEASEATSSEAQKATPAALWVSVKTICQSRDFWWIAMWYFCQFSVHMSFGGLWGGPYLMDVHGLTRSQAGGVLLMMGFGMLAGGPLAGWLSEAVFQARRPVMLLNAAGLAVLFAILALWGARLPVWSFYPWFFALAVCGMGATAVGFAAVRDLFGDEATGTGSGLLNTFPSLFGVTIFQPLTGWLLESQGRMPGGGFSAEAYALSCLLYIGVALMGLYSAWAVAEPMQVTTVAFGKASAARALSH